MFQHVGKWEKIFEMYTVYEMHTVYTITHSDDRFIASERDPRCYSFGSFELTADKTFL